MSALPKYKFVKEEIKKWILEGKVTPHEKTASENELMNTFGVSRHTARQAIGELVSEGWLYREQGVGTFCADRRTSQRAAEDKTIGIITTYISDYIFPSIIRGAESYLTSRGYSVLLSSTNNDIDKERQCLNNLFDRNIAGLIVEPTKSAVYNPNLAYYLNLQYRKLPCLMINAAYDGLNALSLTLDDEQGGFLVTEHLLSLGHRKIIGIFKTDDRQGMNRMRGYINAHEKFGLPISPEWIVSYNTKEKNVLPSAAVRGLLNAKRDRPTAIICYNDEIAIQILHVIRDLQLRVPEDISITGYDDSQLAEATEVKLTSVCHPKHIMGETAAKLMVSMIEQETESRESILFEPKLIIRESTCPPKPERIH